MRSIAFLATFLALAGCTSKKPATWAPDVVVAQAPAPEPVTAPQPSAPVPQPQPALPKKELGNPWSEGTANATLIGLTDDELIALIGEPFSITADPRFGDRRQYHYTEKKWLKPDPADPSAKGPSGMNVILRNGKVILVWRQ